MKALKGIDYFYNDTLRNQVIIGSGGLLYASSGKAENLLELLCEANGRSLSGSISLFSKVNRSHQKSGVLVNPNQQEIYFPTHAGNNAACIWINYGHINKLTAAPFNECIIHFDSGAMLQVKCSRRVIQRQMKRCLCVLKSLCNPYEIISEMVSPI
ncbi:MAG: competence protein ComK [Erysipelotrichaceae bacterium]|nr:competence protein ComK [Erysipelotrichaceae bacterium]